MVKINPIKETVNKVLGTKAKITDIKDTNIFGIHLHTQKALEEFQEKSGMKGPYTAEYQHHYWAAVGRMQLENQILDVCIPLVLYNYPQQVTGGSVKFDLREVSAMGDQLVELADAKCKEFLNVCGAKMTEVLGLTWTYVPQMTMHVHPGRMSVFSGTDYDKKIDDPGVVYPLSAGENLPSFSSIMGHDRSKPVLLRTEYRLFNGEEDGDKNYKHGRCISYIRRDKRENGPIEAMFVGNKQLEASYILKDGLKEKEGDEVLEILTKIFDSSNFEPSTDFILPKNVTRGFGRNIHQATGRQWGKPVGTTPGKQTTMFDEANEKNQKQNVGEIGDYTELEIREMRRFLISEGDFRIQQAYNMSEEDVLFFYVATVDEMETEKRKDIPVDIIESTKILVTIDNSTLDDETVLVKERDGENGLSWMHHTEEEYEFLKSNGFIDTDIYNMEDHEITFILNELGFESEFAK